MTYFKTCQKPGTANAKYVDIQHNKTRRTFCTNDKYFSSPFRFHCLGFALCKVILLANHVVGCYAKVFRLVKSRMGNFNLAI